MDAAASDMQFYSENHREVLAALVVDARRDDPYAVRRACVECARLVLHRDAVRHEMVSDGGLLPQLVDAASGHVDSQPEVVADLCRFLQRLVSLKGMHGSVCVLALWGGVNS